MIRRNPTLIPLEDADVSDIKEFMARRKLVFAEQASKDGKKDDKKVPFVAAEDAKRKREAMIREERIGSR